MNIEDGVIPWDELNMEPDSGDPIVVVDVLCQNSDLESGAERTGDAS